MADSTDLLRPSNERRPHFTKRDVVVVPLMVMGEKMMRSRRHRAFVFCIWYLLAIQTKSPIINVLHSPPQDISI